MDSESVFFHLGLLLLRARGLSRGDHLIPLLPLRLRRRCVFQLLPTHPPLLSDSYLLFINLDQAAAGGAEDGGDGDDGDGDHGGEGEEPAQPVRPARVHDPLHLQRRVLHQAHHEDRLSSKSE